MPNRFWNGQSKKSEAYAPAYESRRAREAATAFRFVNWIFILYGHKSILGDKLV